MTHTKMLTTRRRKQKAKKHLAGIAKRAKKLKKQTVKLASASVLKNHSS